MIPVNTSLLLWGCTHSWGDNVLELVWDVFAVVGRLRSSRCAEASCVVGVAGRRGLGERS